MEHERGRLIAKSKPHQNLRLQETFDQRQIRDIRYHMQLRINLIIYATTSPLAALVSKMKTSAEPCSRNPAETMLQMSRRRKAGRVRWSRERAEVL